LEKKLRDKGQEIFRIDEELFTLKQRIEGGEATVDEKERFKEINTRLRP
jgi:3-dehydroquinate dehydratase